MSNLRKGDQTLEEYVQMIYDLEEEIDYSNQNMISLKEKYHLAHSALKEKFKNRNKDVNSLAKVFKETKQKRRIDTIRDAGGSVDVGTKEDGEIIDMITLNGKLIIVKEKAIYELMTADKVDPERENPNLPTTIQKKIISKGSDSEIVSRTFLTSRMLIRSEFFDESVNTDRATELSLELLHELGVLEKEISEYIDLEEKVIKEYYERKAVGGSYEIPSIGDIETRCKTIFQKADHVEQIIMEIIILFYPNDKLTKQSHFPKFHDIILAKYSKEDPFSKYIEATLNFMKIVRGIRNGLDHRLSSTKVTDFELQKSSDILSPTIEFKYKDVELKKVDLSAFLPIVLNNLIGIFENTVAYLCNKTTNSYMGYYVKEIPEHKRRFPKVKYCFWAPLGDEGFYNQYLK